MDVDHEPKESEAVATEGTEEIAEAQGPFPGCGDRESLDMVLAKAAAPKGPHLLSDWDNSRPPTINIEDSPSESKSASHDFAAAAVSGTAFEKYDRLQKLLETMKGRIKELEAASAAKPSGCDVVGPSNCGASSCDVAATSEPRFERTGSSVDIGETLLQCDVADTQAAFNIFLDETLPLDVSEEVPKLHRTSAPPARSQDVEPSQRDVNMDNNDEQEIAPVNLDSAFKAASSEPEQAAEPTMDALEPIHRKCEDPPVEPVGEDLPKNDGGGGEPPAEQASKVGAASELISPVKDLDVSKLVWE